MVGQTLGKLDKAIGTITAKLEAQAGAAAGGAGGGGAGGGDGGGMIKFYTLFEKVFLIFSVNLFIGLLHQNNP